MDATPLKIEKINSTRLSAGLYRIACEGIYSKVVARWFSTFPSKGWVNRCGTTVDFELEEDAVLWLFLFSGKPDNALGRGQR